MTDQATIEWLQVRSYDSVSYNVVVGGKNRNMMGVEPTVQYGLVVRGHSVGLRRGAATHQSLAAQGKI